MLMTWQDPIAAAAALQLITLVPFDTFESKQSAAGLSPRTVSTKWMGFRGAQPRGAGMVWAVHALTLFANLATHGCCCN